MVDFAHELEIAADRETVRDLIARHGDKWWTTNAVVCGVEGGACEFQFPDAGFFAVMRVMKNTLYLIEWRCVGSVLSAAALKANGGTDPHEWAGTTIRFELSATGPAATHLRLEHLGLGASANYYTTKDNVWAFYLGSLKKLAETGKGEPYQGGPPSAQTDAPVTLTIAFKVLPDKIDTATRAIGTFIDNIARNEPDTLVYRAYRDAEEPRSFVHYMVFRNAEAHRRHRGSAYCAAFVKLLYPCCEANPRATALALFREVSVVTTGAGAA